MRVLRVPHGGLRGLAGLVALLWCLWPAAAHAHLMMPQRGTLNFVDGGAYMVLSIPVSAFPYTHDASPAASAAAAEASVHHKNPQLLSAESYAVHRHQMELDVETHVQLRDDAGPLPLEGIFINFTPPDDDPKGAASHVVVLGRYKLRNPDDAFKARLHWRIALFGTGANEQSFTTTVTRTNPRTGEKERQLLVLGTQSPERSLFPPAWTVVQSFALLGMEHIFTGLDHLLFLLVVLAAARSVRQVLLVLTSFTAGHAVTLSISLLGGVEVPARWVEPAIALTIVGVALYDLWARERRHPMPQRVRLGVVFACALVHGLGLAASLKALGLDPNHTGLSLLGFNAGIELGQIGASLAVALVVGALVRIGGARMLRWARTLAGFLAVGVGGFWLVQRLAST